MKRRFPPALWILGVLLAWVFGLWVYYALRQDEPASTSSKNSAELSSTDTENDLKQSSQAAAPKKVTVHLPRSRKKTTWNQETLSDVEEGLKNGDISSVSTAVQGSEKGPVATETLIPVGVGISKKKAWDCRKNPPESWIVDGETPEDYEITQPESGTILIRSLMPDPRPHVEWNHCAVLPKVRGGRLYFSVDLKGENISNYANLHVRSYDADGFRISDEKRSFRDSFSWKNLEVVAEVPELATSVIYGITFESAGRVWIRRPRWRVESN